ncbi:Uncharacterized protein conserved in bacteria with the myosin-like domain [Megamonas hypermegale]|uniref:Uncharacterized protein conserved in bacteria with the myosin-like domain n=1 Tax=Megamonas hypermegale TaxID=158847 RepID=A0A378NVQ2_9FIRM|nr:DUF3084 domain-containing protein [Megamonas hypermegale]STY71956.1 Uncharacterized protein conserved in bacteria with the myosin-like domain [Megamonas hypermegale]
MYGIMLIVVLVLTGGVIAFIGDRLGSKVGKKKLSLFGLRPRHTSILVTIITGILITTVTFGILAIASKDVRTALFGMNKLKAELNEKQSMLEEASGALVNVKNDLNTTKEEYAKSKKDLEETQEDLEIAQQAAELLRQEQVALQNRNQELWSDNQTLIEHNQSLAENNQFLLANNESLKADNLELEKTNNDLQEGIENIRERPIIYRVGELLASGVIKKTDDPVKIQNDLNQIIALANSKIIDRLGTEGSKDGVWIYPIEYQKAMDRLKQAKGDTVIRLIVAANLVKGDPVLTELEMHPNRVVYQENEFVYQKIYNVPIDGSNSEMLISDFLRNVNMTAINNGILPNPLTGTVGVINGNQIYAIEKALAENRGKDVLISAFAASDTEVLGPLRLHIYLKNETDQEINHEE